MTVSYDNPIRERRSYMAQAFGAEAGTKTFTILGPKGRRGLVRDIEVEITTAMVGTTSVPEIDVGTESGDTSYARFRLGSAAGAGYGTGVKRARSLTKGDGEVPKLTDFAGHVELETALLPPDTPVVITLKEGVDGVEAGTASVHVDIDWF